MRVRGFVLVVVGVGLLLGTTSCKKTLEGETRSWERNNLRAQELSALYPGFAPAIRAQQAKAQAEMDLAKGISNKEEAARKMAECNSMLGGGFIAGLGGVESKVRGVREKTLNASATAPGGTDQLATQTVVADAQRILRSVDESLRRGASDPTAAAAVIHRVDGDLSDAARNLDRVVETNKKRQEAAKGAPGSGTAAPAVGGAEAAPKAVPATWKCKYCGKQQQDPALKCKNCGASR